MSVSTSRKQFRTFNLVAVIMLFLVILAGGVVRSSGSGMGCPDWPKCFGRYVPPTDVSQLPADYKQKYVDGRVKKNLRFARTLDVFGYSDLATRIREDRSILVPEDFNAGKTWTEYVNRLVGALSGIFLLLTAIYSFTYWSVDKSIAIAAVLNLIMIVFQAWLGSIVVSTNLVAWIVTVHMLLALVIIALSIYSYHAAKVCGKPRAQTKGFVLILTVVVLLLSVAQITLGTEVREKIDEVSSHLQGANRNEWVKRAGDVFSHHRDVATAVLFINLALYALIRKNYSRQSIHQQLMSFTFLMLMLQVVTGIALSYFALPPYAQASHIVLASLLFSTQFYLLLNLFRSKHAVEVTT